jgi:hypothetical protein
MNKEEAYDEKINPLMAQIIEICNEHKIAMVTSFAIPIEDDPELFCSTSTTDENGEYPFHLKAMRQAIENALRGRSGPMLMMTVEKADGSKEMTAIVG